MIFGDTPVSEAEGALLAHSVRLPGGRLEKGRRLSPDDIAALAAAGIASVVAARLEAGDVHEDEAAERLARALAPRGVDHGAAFTGRVNLFAPAVGLCAVDAGRIDRVNRLDEAVTIATLPAWEDCAAGQMLATVKIIPFSVPETILAEAEAILGAGAEPTLALRPYRGRSVALIQTEIPGTTAGKMLDKTVRVTRDRLTPLGCRLIAESRCAHATMELAAQLRILVTRHRPELLLIAGASAITDRRDVLPAAIEAAGGRVDHFGMPVDPGNLLLLGSLDGVPVLGLPGCARSPKLNGFDWVLRRLVADVTVGRGDLMGMGVGGLLTEIPSRPQPREMPMPQPDAPPRIAALVLAAGQSRRMGPSNKLLSELEGKALLLHAVDAALASRADPVVVVTGHESARVRMALAERPVAIVHNPDYAEGLSTSLRAGLAALPEGIDAALVCLGDMPRLTPQALDRLIDAYAPEEGRAIVLPTVQGKRGNPVLWDRRFFDEMARLAGDVGARHLIGEHAALVAEVPFDDAAALLDVDTPDALRQIGGRPAPDG